MKAGKIATRVRFMCCFISIAMALILVFANTANSAFAANRVESGNLSKEGMFDIPYSDAEEVYDDARALQEQLVNEGTALLKNDGALPLNPNGGNSKITLFNGSTELNTALSEQGYDVNEFSRAQQVGNAGNISSPNESTISGALNANTGAQQTVGNAGLAIARPAGGSDKLTGTYDIGSHTGAAVVRIMRISGEANDLSTGRSLLNSSNTSAVRNRNLEQFGDITWIDNTKPIANGKGVIVEYDQVKYDAGKLDEAWPDGTPKGYNHANLAPTDPLAIYSTDKALADRDLEPVRHSLMLSRDEELLIQYTKANFDTVIIVWDSITQFEMGDLNDDPGISAIIHSGRLTNTNLNNPAAFASRAVARVMAGEVNPSAHLVSQWDRDMTADPSWQNFGDNFQNDSSILYRYSDGTPTGLQGRNSVGGGNGLHGVEYEEGIYLGYKYYETYWNETAQGNTALSVNNGVWSKDNQDAADEWHRDSVVYPYGYGLSYTSFDYEISGVYTDSKGKNPIGEKVDGSIFASSEGNPADVKTLYVAVKVTNTGSVAGKAVVQLYATAPYIDGGVEKAFVSSLEFDKTNTLNPKRSQTMVIPFEVQDMASFDYDNRANASATGGFILDEGEYVIRAMNSSSVLRSSAKDDFTFEIENGGKAVALRLDDFSDNLVVPVFSTPGTRDYTIRDGTVMADTSNEMTTMSRNSKDGGLDGTFPMAPGYKDLTFNDLYIDDYVRSEISYLAGHTRARADLGLTTPASAYTAALASASGAWYVDSNPNTNDGKRADYQYLDDETDPWFISEQEFDQLTSDWTQASQEYRDDQPWADTMLREMAGVPMYLDGGSVNPRWSEFLNGLTMLELRMIASEGNTSLARIDAIDKNRTSANDNTSVINNMYHWGDQPILARTFNKNIAAEHGKLTACYAAFGKNVLGVDTNAPTGWWSPGANLQRSPFSGRNGDYYGQDSRIAGIFTAAVTASAEEYGLACWIKHPVLNDQETNRNGNSLFTWVDEQTMRENYFPNAQKAFQEGDAQGNMQSFARIGGVVYAYSHAMNVEVIKNQWGWTGISVTDMLAGQRSHPYTVPEKATNWWDSAVGIDGATYDTNRTLDQTKNWLDGRTVTLDQLIRGAQGTPDANNASLGSVHNYDEAGMNVVSITNSIMSAANPNSGSPIITNTTNPKATLTVQSANANPASGNWAPNMRNGKGGVYLEYEKGANDPATMNIAAANMTDTGRNQWYGVRMTAMYACYEAANSRGNQNGMLTNDRTSQLRFYHGTSQVVSNLTQGTRIPVVSVNLEKVTNGRQSLYGNTVSYSVISGILPEGLTLNPETGLISGIPTTAITQETEVTIQCKVANYLFGNHTVKFAPVVAVLNAGDATTSIKVGKSVSGQFIGGTGDWSAIGLPEGVTLAADGILSGTPTIAGTYNVVLTRGTMNLIHTITVAGITGVELNDGVLELVYSDGDKETISTVMTSEQVQALIDASITGKLTETQVQALIDASITGKLDATQVQALIDASITGKLTETQVQALIDAAIKDNLTKAEIQTLIDESLSAQSGGCGSEVSNLGVLSVSALLALCMLLVLVKRRKLKKD